MRILGSQQSAVGQTPKEPGCAEGGVKKDVTRSGGDGRKSRRDGLRRLASKSASEYQKKDDAALRHSKLRILQWMKAVGKRSWKRKASGAFRKEG